MKGNTYSVHLQDTRVTAAPTIGASVGPPTTAIAYNDIAVPRTFGR
jgi:hypothetical protein